MARPSMLGRTGVSIRISRYVRVRRVLRERMFATTPVRFLRRLNLLAEIEPDQPLSASEAEPWSHGFVLQANIDVPGAPVTNDHGDTTRDVTDARLSDLDPTSAEGRAPTPGEIVEPATAPSHPAVTRAPGKGSARASTRVPPSTTLPRSGKR